MFEFSEMHLHSCKHSSNWNEYLVLSHMMVIYICESGRARDRSSDIRLRFFLFIYFLLTAVACSCREFVKRKEKQGRKALPFQSLASYHFFFFFFFLAVLKRWHGADHVEESVELYMWREAQRCDITTRVFYRNRFLIGLFRKDWNVDITKGIYFKKFF